MFPGSTVEVNVILDMSYSEAVKQVMDDPEILGLIVVIALLMLTAGRKSSAKVRDDGLVVKEEKE